MLDTARITEAEQAVLGVLLEAGKTFPYVAELVSDEDFMVPAHRQVFAAIRRVYERGAEPDLELVAREMGNGIAAIGGPAFLLGLHRAGAKSSNVRAYALNVRDEARLRALADLGGRLMRGGEIESLLADAEASIRDVRRRSRRVEWEPKGASLRRLYARLTGPLEEDATRLPTGLHSIDLMLGGLSWGHLIAVGARPSVGKTSLATTVAHFVALKLNRPVAFFSCEMLRDDIWTKLWAIETRIPYGVLKSHDLSPHAKERLWQAVVAVDDAPIDVMPAREWTVQMIRDAARTYAQAHPHPLIVVDYLQLIGVEGKFENRTTQVTAISKHLKAMAVELEAPVIALAQFNRAPDARGGGEPNLSDFRESGAIEQDCDVALLMWRPPDEPSDLVSTAVRVAKNRVGETGLTTLAFHGALMEFREFAHGF